MIGGILKGAAELTKGIGGIIDNATTSQEEKADMKNKFASIMTEYHAGIESEVSARHVADMNSDNKLSKNIRPILTGYLTVICSILAITDGNINIGEFSFTIGKEWIELFKTLLVTAFIFYFGSRGAEKVTEAIGKYKIKTNRAMNLEAKAELERAKRD